MEAIALILVTSLALYGVFRPYQDHLATSGRAGVGCFKIWESV